MMNENINAHEIVKAKDALLLGIIAKMVTPALADLVETKYVKLFKETGERGGLIFNLLETILGYYVPGATMRKGRAYTSICLPPVVKDAAHTAALMLDAVSENAETEDLYNASKDLLGLLTRQTYTLNREQHKARRHALMGQPIEGAHVRLDDNPIVRHPGVDEIVLVDNNRSPRTQRRNLRDGYFIGGIQGNSLLDPSRAFSSGFTEDPRLPNYYRGSRDDHPCLWAAFLDSGIRGFASEVAWVYVVDILTEFIKYSRTLHRTLAILSPANPESPMSKFIKTDKAKATLLRNIMARLQRSIIGRWETGKGYAAHTVGGPRYRLPYSGDQSAGSLRVTELATVTEVTLSGMGVTPRLLKLLEEGGVPISVLLSVENLMKLAANLSNIIQDLNTAGGDSEGLSTSTSVTVRRNKLFMAAISGYATESETMFTKALGSKGYQELLEITKQPEQLRPQQIYAPTPEEGTPAEGTPVEGTPVEGTPVEGTPVEGTPVEEPSITINQASEDRLEVNVRIPEEGTIEDDGEDADDEGDADDGEDTANMNVIDLDSIVVTRAEPMAAPESEDASIAAIIAQLRAEGIL